MTQLQDIEEMKDEMDADEYTTSKQETIDQLKEFEQSLTKMTQGNISLVDHIGSVQLAIQAAIRNVTSPEILNMFLKKENGSLRRRLADLDQDLKLGRMTLDDHNSQAGEILKLLEKLGEPLSLGEKELLRKMTRNMDGYEVASDNISKALLVLLYFCSFCFSILGD